MSKIDIRHYTDDELRALGFNEKSIQLIRYNNKFLNLIINEIFLLYTDEELNILLQNKENN